MMLRPSPSVPRFAALAALCGLACATPAPALAQSAPVSLAGEWSFALDRGDAGLREEWFKRALADKITLPGALQHQGYGDEISLTTPWTAALHRRNTRWPSQYPAKFTEPGNVLVPFFLTPPRTYVGAAWYQRDFTVPAAWQGRRVQLTLERPHWETAVWVGDRYVGVNRSLGTPHVYDLGLLAPGTYRLTVRVNNTMVAPVGVDAHSVSDETQTNWNGLVGKLELSATSPVWLKSVQVFPDVAKKAARVKVLIGNAGGLAGAGELMVSRAVADSGGPAGPLQRQAVTWTAEGGSADFEVPLGANAPLWNEFTPNLIALEVGLTGDRADDRRGVRFGLRQMGRDGYHITVNGQPVTMRGTLECAIFPLTGYPAMDKEYWLKIFRTCKDFGLNHMRFHSWCPPGAAFEAADEMGFFLLPECGIWARDGVSITNPATVRFLNEESDAILEAYGNHPSFALMAHGNEPSGGIAPLVQWMNAARSKDPRRLYTTAVGWGQSPENDFDAAMAAVDRNNARVRGDSGWRGRDFDAGAQASPVPLISHENGQFCVYPNFDEIAKYTGALKPGNLIIFRDLAEQSGILADNIAIAYASGKLQALCYKEEIEAVLRSKSLAGFQLLDLHDFPGQGTALVGVLDAFWDPKGYITAAEWRQFCGPTVPLARLTKRLFTTNETLSAPVEMTNFGPGPIAGAKPYWELRDRAGKVVAGGEFDGLDVPLAAGTKLGTVSASLAALPAPAEYELVAGLRGTEIKNTWDIWVYPQVLDESVPAGVGLTGALDDAALAQLAAGGTVLWFPPAQQVGAAHPPSAFQPIFWNGQMSFSASRQTLGLLVDPQHPALAKFPTHPWSGWQWERIVQGARAFDMAGLPRDAKPLIQIIDDWNTARKLALAFECRVGPGKLIVCGANLPQLAVAAPPARPQADPAARQLLRSLLDYAAGPQFQPQLALDATQVREFVARAARVQPLPPDASLPENPVMAN